MQGPERTAHFTSVKFSNYKTFERFSVRLEEFNVLVGPNNCGKSTILGAFRILSEGLRRANTRKPDWETGQTGTGFGYPVNLSGVPISTENVFHNYDDSVQSSVTFRISNGNELTLRFPDKGCLLDGI